MKKNNLILVFTLGFVLTGVIAAATQASREDFVDSETQALLDLQAQNPTDKASLEMLKYLPTLQDRDRQINQWIEEYEKMSEEEKKVISDAAQKSYDDRRHQIQQYEAYLQENPTKPGPLQPDETRGIHEKSLSDSVDIKAYKAFDVYWSAGREPEEWNAPIFSSGYKFENPLQGLVEYHHGWERDFKYYPSPTATGPLKIVSEKDGVLTLVSVAGEYAMHDLAGENPERIVKAPGGSTYLFDTNTLQFITR